ncbi:hypothetical protein AVEN_106557-1 [Araneus ventricosus]|uniref:Uncharacterized protein n=1 Tax=Araneus ventricosus TaxID=182803 RepID=A0A4Y2T4Z2_ARAVE|nr:hypothetical protein AVEN_106557-1 [Araneus ventricosus]
MRSLLAASFNTLVCGRCSKKRSNSSYYACLVSMFFVGFYTLLDVLIKYRFATMGYATMGYATECIYTVSWHIRKPAPNFEQEWLKRVANNLVSRQKIRGIIKFINENRDLFRPPQPSTSQRAELSSSITRHFPFK